MADELGAVLEAPEVAEEAVEQVGATETPEVEQAESEGQAEEFSGDERGLPKYIKDYKATNPEAFKALKTNWFRLKTFDDKLKDFDLDGTKSWLEEKGGRDAINATFEELQGKASEYDGLLQKIETGDASVLKDISAESLAKLAPSVFDQWSQSDPEGWEATMSGLFAATIANSKIDSFIEKMELYLEVGKPEQIGPMLQQLKTWTASFGAKASAPRQAKPSQQQTSQLSEREQALNKRESEAFAADIRKDRDSFRDTEINRELGDYFKRRPQDNDAKNLAIDTVRAKVNSQMQADQDLQKSINNLLSRKDKDGVLRLIKSREAAAIKQIAPTVGKTIFGNPAPPKVEKQEAKPTPQLRPAKPQPKADPKESLLASILSR